MYNLLKLKQLKKNNSYTLYLILSILSCIVLFLPLGIYEPNLYIPKSFVLLEYNCFIIFIIDICDQY